MAAGRVELTLLGQTLTVRTEAEPEYVRMLARYLRPETIRTLERARTVLHTAYGQAA